jgi:acyl-CoA synthetase (AMP-forming)/AMP-acid ligase II
VHVAQYLHIGEQRDSGRVMTVCAERVRTVAESVGRVARLAGGLRSLGLDAGDRVAILARNSDRYLEFLSACAWSGLVAVPLNTRWTVAEHAFALEDAGARALLADDALADSATRLRELCPGLAYLVHCGDADPGEPTWLRYEELVASSAPMPDAYHGGSDLFGVFYTGGTSGRAKGVMLSHDDFMGNSISTLATHRAVTPGGRFLHVAPLFHVADLAAWMMANLCQATHVIVPAFEPATVLSTVQRARITDTMLVPSMLQLLADHPDAADADLSSIRNVIYGASPMTDAVLERSMELFPNAEFTQAYGMTELGPVATLLLPDDHRDPVRRRSAGRSIVSMDVRVVDPDDREAQHGVVGEIVVRGAGLMSGYWGKPAQTREAVRDGWMHTGDAGYLDDRGYLFLVDRIKDMIVTGGENVYSVEVENALARHPAVAACAVIGVPDSTYGERVHAVVVFHADVQAPPSETELADFCRASIAGYKVPRSFEFVDRLPISGAGKVLKRELRATHWAGHERRVH